MDGCCSFTSGWVDERVSPAERRAAASVGNARQLLPRVPPPVLDSVPTASRLLLPNRPRRLPSRRTRLSAGGCRRRHHRTQQHMKMRRVPFRVGSGDDPLPYVESQLLVLTSRWGRATAVPHRGRRGSSLPFCCMRSGEPPGGAGFGQRQVSEAGLCTGRLSCWAVTFFGCRHGAIGEP